MGGSSPSTVTSPFNSLTNASVGQSQMMTGNLATAGQQSFTPNAQSQYVGGLLANTAAGLPGAAQVPGQQIAGFDPTQEAAMQQIYGAGTGLGGLVGQGANAVGQGMWGTYQAGQGLTGEDVGSFYNPMAGNITAQMQNIFGQQNAQATGNAAKTAGGVGASRIGVAQGNLANQQGLAAGQTYAALYQNALQAAQQQKQQQLAAGNALATQGGNAIQTGMGGLNAAYQTGATRQALEQLALTSQYQQQLGQYQAPYQQLAAQNAAMQGLGTLGGTTSQVGGQQGTQTGNMNSVASTTNTGVQATQYPEPSLTSQIAGLGGLAIGAAGLFLNRGGRTYARGGATRRDRSFAGGGQADTSGLRDPTTGIWYMGPGSGREFEGNPDPWLVALQGGNPQAAAVPAPAPAAYVAPAAPAPLPPPTPRWDANWKPNAVSGLPTAARAGLVSGATSGVPQAATAWGGSGIPSAPSVPAPNQVSAPPAAASKPQPPGLVPAPHPVPGGGMFRGGRAYARGGVSREDRSFARGGEGAASSAAMGGDAGAWLAQQDQSRFDSWNVGAYPITASDPLGLGHGASAEEDRQRTQNTLRAMGYEGGFGAPAAAAAPAAAYVAPPAPAPLPPPTPRWDAGWKPSAVSALPTAARAGLVSPSGLAGVAQNTPAWSGPSVPAAPSAPAASAVPNSAPTTAAPASAPAAAAPHLVPGGKARGGRLRRLASGGSAASILPYTPMTSLFGTGVSASVPKSVPGPQGPVKSDVDAITGDIQKFVNLRNLYKKAPFANQKPGVTNQATPDINNYQTDREAGPSESYDESPSNEYQEGGDVEDQTDTQDQGDDNQPNWGRMLGLETPMPVPRPATFDERFGNLPPARGEDVQTGEPPANFAERFGNLPSPPGALTGEGVQMPLPRPAAADAGIPLPTPRPAVAGAGTEAAPLRGGRGIGGLGGVAGGFADRLSDPRRLALIQMGLGMAAASGQRDARGLPMSPLAVIGQGGSQGLQAYQKGAAQRTLEASRLNQMAVANQRQLEQVRHNKMLEQYYYGAPKEGAVPQLPGIGAPSGGALVDAGEPPEKVAEGKVPTMDAISLEPGGDRRRMDPPPPPPTGNYSSEAIATAGEQYAQTGKLPAGLSRDKEFRAAVMNYGGEVLKSRGITHSQAVEMWRFAPRQAGWIMGADGRQAGSMGTVIDHLDTLKELTRALKNGDNQTYNLIRNKYKKWTGENTPTDVETGAPIIGAEIMKAVGAAGAGTGAERETAGLNLGDLSKSPAQFEGAITTAQKLVAGQLRTKTRQAEAIGLPRERLDALVGKRAREVLDSLPAEGSEAPKTPLAPAQAAPAAAQPSASDRAYAKAHPEVRELFIKRFGVEP